MARRYVLIGSGIASLSAAESIRRLDPHATITLVSEQPHDFCSRSGLAHLLRKDLPERQLNSLLKNVAWTPRPSENQLESDGRGVRPTVFQQAA